MRDYTPIDYAQECTHKDCARDESSNESSAGSGRAALRHSAKVISSQLLAPGIMEMALLAPAAAREVQPGQFVHIRIADGLDPLLRRPLSAGRVEGPSLTLLFRVAGRGTQLFSRAKPGDEFDLLGPLGNPFTLHPDRPAILIAGGMGIAVFPLLARRLREAGCVQVHLLYGARNAAELVWASPPSEFDAAHCAISLATDDGSAGYRGVCTDLLPGVLAAAAKDSPQPPAIYACGPEPMFRAILRRVQDPAIPIQLSFEQRMGCGFGACLACAVETNRGYMRVCKEGPVFDGSLFRGCEA